MADKGRCKVKQKRRGRENPEMIYITRSHTTKSWYVRVPNAKAKMFYDSWYNGDKFASLLDSKMHRDKCIAEVGMPKHGYLVTGMPYFRNRLSADNKSGINGVFETKYDYMKKVRGRKYKVYCHMWVASWATPEKNHIKQFNINTHGYEKAKQMAIDFRNDKEKEMLETYDSCLKNLKPLRQRRKNEPCNN